MKKKEIFVLYSHDNEEHKKNVLDLVNYLRINGYNATYDSNIIQENAGDINLDRMMHDAITKYGKIVIVLSAGYKKKAENFKGGVGNEFELILRDMCNRRKKYILVSFEHFEQPTEIAPLKFEGRYILDLSKEENYYLLLSFIREETYIPVEPVAGEKNTLEKAVIPEKVFKQIYDLRIEKIYQQCFSRSFDSYFNLLGAAGKAYDLITHLNIKVGYWSEDKGYDHTLVYYIAGRIKERYENRWTKNKSQSEVAADILDQIDNYHKFERGR